MMGSLYFVQSEMLFTHTSHCLVFFTEQVSCDMVLREELTYGIFTEWLKTRKVSNLLVPHIAGWWKSAILGVLTLG